MTSFLVNGSVNRDVGDFSGTPYVAAGTSDIFNQENLAKIASQQAATLSLKFSPPDTVNEESPYDNALPYDEPLEAPSLISSNTLPLNDLQRKLETKDFALQSAETSSRPAPHERTISNGNGDYRDINTQPSLLSAPSGFATPIKKFADQTGSTRSISVVKPSLSSLSATFPNLPSSCYIKATDLEIVEEIGAGEFGMVYLGKYNGKMVAVKMIKVHLTTHDKTIEKTIEKGYSPEDEEKKRKQIQERVEALQREAFIMHTVAKHPNVVDFIGVSILEGKLALVTSFCGKGSVDLYVHREIGSSSSSSNQRLLRFSLDAAKGISHLHKNQVIHQDIAARNYLLADNLTLQVADFGLARFLGPGEVSKSDLCAVQWSSPEVILKKQFSKASDCFAYGVSIWEIFQGQAPFSNLKKIQVGFWVALRGMRLIINSSWPQSIQKLMTQCWKENPEDRPPFEFVVTYLEAALKDLIEAEGEEEEEDIAQVRLGEFPRVKSVSITKMAPKGTGKEDTVERRRELAAAAHPPPATIVRVKHRLSNIAKPLPAAPGVSRGIPPPPSPFASASEIQSRVLALQAASATTTAGGAQPPRPVPVNPLTPERRKRLLEFAHARVGSLPPPQTVGLTLGKQAELTSIPFSAFSSSPYAVPVDAIALYDFLDLPSVPPVGGAKESYLSFRRGQIIRLIKYDIVDDWWTALLNEKKGLIPANRVKILDKDPKNTTNLLHTINHLQERLAALQARPDPAHSRAIQKLQAEKRRLQARLEELKAEEERIAAEKQTPIVFSSGTTPISSSAAVNTYLSKHRSKSRNKSSTSTPEVDYDSVLLHRPQLGKQISATSPGQQSIPIPTATVATKPIPYTSLVQPRMVNNYLMAYIDGIECKGMYNPRSTYTSLFSYTVPPHPSITKIVAIVTDIPDTITNREDPEDILIFVPAASALHNLYEYIQNHPTSKQSIVKWIEQLIGVLEHLHKNNALYSSLHADIISLTAELDISLPPVPLNHLNEDITARYQAPETIIEGQMSPATDIWQVGLLMSELIKKGRVYEDRMSYVDNNTNALLIGIATGEIKPSVDPTSQSFIGEEYIKIMLQCFEEKDKRPTLDQIKTKLINVV